MFVVTDLWFERWIFCVRFLVRYLLEHQGSKDPKCDIAFDQVLKILELWFQSVLALAVDVLNEVFQPLLGPMVIPW